MQSGESSGTTGLNRKYVSSIWLGNLLNDIKDVFGYAESTSNDFIKNFDKFSLADIIPTVVIGEGNVINAGKSPDFLLVRSDVKDERGYKRLNIRMISVPEDFKLLTANILNNIAPESDIKICSFEEIGYIKDPSTGEFKCDASKVKRLSDLWGESQTAKEIVMRSLGAPVISSAQESIAESQSSRSFVAELEASNKRKITNTNELDLLPNDSVGGRDR